MKARTANGTEECKIHGNTSRAVNKTLLSLIIAALALVVWHVWVYGPAGQGAEAGPSSEPFPILLGRELWDLVFSGHGILAELKDVFVYFLIGVFLAGFIRTYKLAIMLRNSLIRYGFLSIFIAALVGIMTPLCACGILTTAVSLLFAGLPLAPVMALLVSSPLISPSAYLLTLSDLGPHWTVIRTVAAFLMGIFAGVLTHLIRNRGFQTNSLFLEGAIPRGDFHDESYPDERLKCNCKIRFGNRVAARTKNMFLIFLAKSWEMFGIVGKYVLVGIAVGTIIERYMPSEWIFNLFGKDDRLNIVWITFGSVPIFLHQISASSILHHIKSTLDGTLNGGAGLAFLIGGPVTAIPTMTMLWAIFKKRVFVLYMFICIVGTIIIAFSFQYFVFVPHVDMDNPLLKGVQSVSGGQSSFIVKKGKNVRMVMDPGGMGIIAMYENVLEGTGGVVFDASHERLYGSSAGRYDNQKYITNVARWLEETGSTVGKRILIYNTEYAPARGSSELSENVSAFLRKRGNYEADFTDRTMTPAVTAELLEKYDQLWIVYGESGSGCCFNDGERETIIRFVDDGKGMFLLAGSQRGAGDEGLIGPNQLAPHFGVQFTGLAENPGELNASSYAYFFNKVAEVLERIYRSMT